jgi:hypothetical protein
MSSLEDPSPFRCPNVPFTIWYCELDKVFFKIDMPYVILDWEKLHKNILEKAFTYLGVFLLSFNSMALKFKFKFFLHRGTILIFFN